jgi:hypothetical protein
MTEIENIDRLSFLKGYLLAFATLNSFCNDGKTYTIELLNKINNNITDTLKEYYKVKNWIFTTEKIGGQWQDFLAKDIRQYFDQILIEVFHKTNPDEFRNEKGHYKNDIEKKIEQLRKDQDLNIDFVVGKFVQHLKTYVGTDSEIIKIEVNWHPPNSEYEGFYECYSNDYIFEIEDKYLYLHFGGSD